MQPTPTPTRHQSHDSRLSSTDPSHLINITSPSLTRQPPSLLFTSRRNNLFGDEEPDTIYCSWFACYFSSHNLRALEKSSVASSLTTNNLWQSRSKTPSTHFYLKREGERQIETERQRETEKDRERTGERDRGAWRNHRASCFPVNHEFGQPGNLPAGESIVLSDPWTADHILTSR